MSDDPKDTHKARRAGAQREYNFHLSQFVDTAAAGGFADANIETQAPDSSNCKPKIGDSFSIEGVGDYTIFAIDPDGKLTVRPGAGGGCGFVEGYDWRDD